MMFRRLFSRQWWWTTLLVIAAVGVMVRLGIWQLDRLDQRRSFNAHVAEQQALPALDINAGIPPAEELEAMEYRAVVVRGVYDHAQEVVLRNQVEGIQPGVHLITPMRIDGSDQAVLVDRGWVPMEAYIQDNLAQYAEPGPVEVRGLIRRSQSRPDYGRQNDPLPPAGERLIAWNLMNIPRMDAQISELLLPVYIQQGKDAGWSGFPVRTEPELDLSEGPHLGYAGQWFLFALVLGAGYPVYLSRQAGALSSGGKLEASKEHLAS